MSHKSQKFVRSPSKPSSRSPATLNLRVDPRAPTQFLTPRRSVHHKKNGSSKRIARLPKTPNCYWCSHPVNLFAKEKTFSTDRLVVFCTRDCWTKYLHQYDSKFILPDSTLISNRLTDSIQLLHDTLLFGHPDSTQSLAISAVLFELLYIRDGQYIAVGRPEVSP